MMKPKRKTLPFNELASEVMRKADKQGKRHAAAAVMAWPKVAGETINRHTKGFSLREDRELVVFVDSAAWANELSLMSDDLAARINAHLGERAVRSLRFTVSRRVKQEATWEAGAAATEEFYEPDQVEPVPLDDSEIRQAEAIAHAVRDPELREVALRVMIKDLERKKGVRTTVVDDTATGGPAEGREAGSKH